MTGFGAPTPASWPVVLLDNGNATSSRRLQDGSGGKGGPGRVRLSPFHPGQASRNYFHTFIHLLSFHPTHSQWAITTPRSQCMLLCWPAASCQLLAVTPVTTLCHLLLCPRFPWQHVIPTSSQLLKHELCVCLPFILCLLSTLSLYTSEI